MQSNASMPGPSKHEPELLAGSVLTIRELVVPQTAPPYDDEPTAATIDADRGKYQPRGTIPKTPPSCQLAENRTDAVIPPDRAGGGPAAPDGWPRQFAQVLAETLAGVRPAQQLTPWTSERARRQIRQLGPVLASGQLPRVRRIMTSAPAKDALELTAVVGCGERVRVLAVRLERDMANVRAPNGGWCCTAVESA